MKAEPLDQYSCRGFSVNTRTFIILSHHSICKGKVDREREELRRGLRERGNRERQKRLVRKGKGRGREVV